MEACRHAGILGYKTALTRTHVVVTYSAQTLRELCSVLCVVEEPTVAVVPMYNRALMLSLRRGQSSQYDFDSCTNTNTAPVV